MCPASWAAARAAIAGVLVAVGVGASGLAAQTLEGSLPESPGRGPVLGVGLAAGRVIRAGRLPVTGSRLAEGRTGIEVQLSTWVPVSGHIELGLSLALWHHPPQGHELLTGLATLAVAPLPSLGLRVGVGAGALRYRQKSNVSIAAGPSESGGAATAPALYLAGAWAIPAGRRLELRPTGYWRTSVGGPRRAVLIDSQYRSFGLGVTLAARL